MPPKKRTVKEVTRVSLRARRPVYLRGGACDTWQQWQRILEAHLLITLVIFSCCSRLPTLTYEGSHLRINNGDILKAFIAGILK